MKNERIILKEIGASVKDCIDFSQAVVLLQGDHGHLILQIGGQALHGGKRSGQGGDAGNFPDGGQGADFFLVFAGAFAFGGVDEYSGPTH